MSQKYKYLFYLNIVRKNVSCEVLTVLPQKSFTFSAKQFACTICFKSFDQVNQLNAHVREHSLKKTSLDLKVKVRMQSYSKIFLIETLSYFSENSYISLL